MNEARLAGAAALLTGLPVWVSFMPRSAGELFNGDPLVEAARFVNQQGVHAILLNCAPPNITEAAFLTLRRALPEAKLGAYPNLYKTKMTPLEFTVWASRLAAQGADIIGGCCGSRPEHIVELARVFKQTP
jgi:S-methylmethionine-dependent homocysteine/selenocysteine methylase